MNWFVLGSAGFNKFLVVSEDTKEEIINHLKAIDKEEIGELSCRRMVIDRPGMISMDRQMYTFHLDGLQVDVPATDFDEVLATLRHLKPHTDWGFFLVESTFHTLVFTVDQCARLAAQMTKHHQEALALASVENERLNQATQELEDMGVYLGRQRPVQHKTSGDSN